MKKKIDNAPGRSVPVTAEKEDLTDLAESKQLSLSRPLPFTRRLLLDDVRQVFVKIGKM